MDRPISVLEGYSQYKGKATEKEYKTIVRGFFSEVMEALFEGESVNLVDIGELVVAGRKVVPKVDDNGKIQGVAPDWGASRKYWKTKADEMGITLNEYIERTPDKVIVRCFNEHSNGRIYNIYWHSKLAKLKNKALYTLRFSRFNKRRLAALIREGMEYAEVRPADVGDNVINDI